MAILSLQKNVFSKEFAQKVVQDIDKREGWEYYTFVPQRMKCHFDKWPEFNEIKNNFLKKKAENYDVTGFFVRYDENTECLVHSDSSVFSCVAFLQKPEQGGDLYVEGKKIDLDVGDIVMFHGADIHYAEPILKGQKFSFVMFLNAPGYWDKEYQKYDKKPTERVGAPVPVRG